jgi:hypothetical protein
LLDGFLAAGVVGVVGSDIYSPRPWARRAWDG